MKLRWKLEGDDWIVQLSGALRWLATGPGPISRLKEEAERFSRDGTGLAIIDLSEVSEADPKNVLELMDALTPLRRQKRARLRGSGSAIAAIFDGDIPWIDGARTEGGPPAQPAPPASTAPSSSAKSSPPTAPATGPGSSWERIIESLPEGNEEARTIWGKAAEKIEAMVEGIDIPSDSETDVIDPRDRAPAVDEPLPSEKKVKKNSTEQLSAPLLWFDDALDELLGEETPPPEPPPKRKTRKKPVQGVKPISQAPPPGSDVFDWFFSMGDAAVRQDEQARRAEQNIANRAGGDSSGAGKSRSPKERKAAPEKATPAASEGATPQKKVGSGGAGPERPATPAAAQEQGGARRAGQPSPVIPAAPAPASASPARPNPVLPPSAPADEPDFDTFGFPDLEEFAVEPKDPVTAGQSAPAASHERAEPPPVAGSTREVVPPLGGSGRETQSPADAAPDSGDGVFEPFGFPSIEEIGDLISEGVSQVEESPRAPLPPRPAGFEKFPQLFPQAPSDSGEIQRTPAPPAKGEATPTPQPSLAPKVSTERSVAQKPVASEPAAREPVAQERVAPNPARQKTIMEKPDAPKPVAPTPVKPSSGSVSVSHPAVGQDSAPRGTPRGSHKVRPAASKITVTRPGSITPAETPASAGTLPREKTPVVGAPSVESSERELVTAGPSMPSSAPRAESRQTPPTSPVPVSPGSPPVTPMASLKKSPVKVERPWVGPPGDTGGPTVSPRAEMKQTPTPQGSPPRSVVPPAETPAAARQQPVTPQQSMPQRPTPQRPTPQPPKVVTPKEATPTAELFSTVASQSVPARASDAAGESASKEKQVTPRHPEPKPISVAPVSPNLPPSPAAEERVASPSMSPSMSPAPTRPEPSAPPQAQAAPTPADPPRPVAQTPSPAPVAEVAKPQPESVSGGAKESPSIEEFLERTGLAVPAVEPVAREAAPGASTPESTPPSAVVKGSDAAPGPSAAPLQSAPASDPAPAADLDEDLEEGFDDDTFRLLTTPTDSNDNSLEEMLAGEVGEEPQVEAPPEDDFVIDLELEEMYLTRSPTQRDVVADKKTLEFASGWSALEQGSEFIEKADKPRPGRPDPVGLLLGGGSDEEDEDYPEPREEPLVDDLWGSTPPPTHPAAARRAKLESAAEPFLQFFPKGPSGGSRGSTRSDEMMRAIGRLLGDYDSADREREELASRYDQLVDTLAEKDQEIENLRRALQAVNAGADAGASPEAPAGWLTTLMVTPSNPDQLRIRFAGSIARFKASGSVDPERVLSDIIELDRRAPRIAAGVGISLERFNGTPGDGWRAILLVLSTLVRDGGDPGRRRRGLRAAWLASLVRNAPGNEETTLDFVVPAVWRLISGRTYRFPGETEIDFTELRDDLALWVACAHLDEHRRLTPKRWRAVVGRTLAEFEEDEQVRKGLSRLVEAHSLYFPGVWVELTTGGIGPVIGANPGRPEFPRVLVLFRRDGMRGSRVAPQLSPTGVDATAGVLRVLSNPHCAEKDGNTLAIDTGGSTVVPKNR